ncbi:MAG TPA: hypothetical protein VN823_18480 [Stellaceae bacterium]|nr:hypothetical protein [Stellaceae bacterium]
MQFTSLTAVVAVAAVLLGGVAHASAAGGCKGSAPLVAVGVDLPEPAIDNTLPQREIQALSPTYHGSRTVGLYWTRIEAQFGTRIRMIGPAIERAAACLSITTVDVHLTMSTRKIYVSKELEPGACTYAAVLTHERKHQMTDDQVLREHAPRIRQAIERAVIDAGPREALPAEREAARAGLTKVVQAAFKKAFDALLSERTALQEQVDAGLEYARVTASCSDWSTLPR